MLQRSWSTYRNRDTGTGVAVKQGRYFYGIDNNTSFQDRRKGKIKQISCKNYVYVII